MTAAKYSNFFPVTSVVLLCAQIFSSCVHIQEMLGESFKKPEIKFNDLYLIGVEADKLLLKAELYVKNTNSMELNLRGVKYQVQSAGQDFAQGVVNDTVELPSQVVKTISVPIEIEYQQAKKVINDFLRFGKKPDLILNFEAEVFSSSGFLRVFHQGSFDLKKIMP